MADPATPVEDAAVVAPAVDPVDEPDEFDEIDDALAALTSVDGQLVENKDILKPEEPVDDGAGVDEPSDEGSEKEEQAGSDDTTTEETGEEVAKPAITTTPEVVVEPDQAGVYKEPIADPGEFKPGDYSFEIVLKDGKTHKVATPEDAEALAELIDENPELVSAKQFIDFNRKFVNMEQGIVNDQRTFDTKKQEFDTDQEQQKVVEATYSQIENGMSYLQGKGLIPEIPADLNKEGVKWEDHTDDPAIKARLDLLAYMAKENESRIAANLDASFDVTSAYNAMQLEKLQNQEVDVARVESDNRRTRGAAVGSPAPAAETPTEEKGSIIGEGGSLSDLWAESYEQQ